MGNKQKLTRVLGVAALAMAIQGCFDNTGDGASPEATSAKALFSPADGADFIPFPIDLLFNDSADGSINVPGQPNSVPAGTDPMEFNPAFIGLNTMDGFGTTSPMVVRFSGPVDDPTDPLDLQNGIKVFAVTSDDPPVPPVPSYDPGAQGNLTVSGQLVWGVDYVAGISGGVSGLIIPLKPLAPSTTHIVAITNDLKTRAGNPVEADDTYALLSGAIRALGANLATSYFITQSDGTPCDFSNPPASLATCDTRNPAFPTLPEELASILKSLSDAELIALEPLRRIVFKHLSALAGAGEDISKVVLSYSVSTQNIGGALQAAQAQALGGTTPTFSVLNPLAAWDPTDMNPIEVVSPGADGDPTGGDDHLAHIYLATLNDTVQFLDPDNLNGGQWRGAGDQNLGFFNMFTPTPVTTGGLPVLISAPRPDIDTFTGGATSCSSAGDLPVLIYQHGITTSRATLLAIADALAQACIVGVAIDLPKHGILPVNDPFGASDIANLFQALQGGTPQMDGTVIPAANAVLERMVRVASPMDDCAAQQGVPVGDGDFYCPSGDNFINLVDLANSRDTTRQGAVDMMSLFEALEEDADGALNPGTIGFTVDDANIHFAGMSLGGIVGAPFVALTPDLVTATFNVSGGGIAKVLDGSPSFEPNITEGLFNAAGIVKPSGDYEGFLLMAQTLVDNTDPINFAEQIAANPTAVLVQEVAGDAGVLAGASCNDDGNCPDQTVPNNTFGSSFGAAWGLISNSGQASFLAGQNTLTTPVALSGTDPFAQGTGFVAMGGAVQLFQETGGMQGLDPTTAVTVLGPLGGDAVTAPATTFKGLGIPSVQACGATGTSGIVRFSNGSHGSLLTPAGPNGATEFLPVTTTMQTQLASFVASGGALIAADANGVVTNPPVAAACAPVP